MSFEHLMERARRSGSAVFRAFAGLLIAGAVVHVVTLWARVRALAQALPAADWAFVAAYAICALTALAACGLAALLLWKAAHRADARALTLFLCFLAIFWGSLFRFMNVSAEENSVNINLTYGSGWVPQTAAASFLLAVAAFVRFSTLFPQPLRPEMLRPARRLHGLRAIRLALLRGPVVWGTAIAVIVLLNWGPGLVMDRLGAPVAPDGTLRRYALIPLWTAAVTYIALPIAGLVLGLRNLRASHRVASDEQRRRVLWVVAGFSAAAWMILSAAGLLALIIIFEIDADALGFAVPVALCLAPLVLVLCAAVGVLHSGAIDASLVLKRTTVWGALGALGVVAFAGIENALSSWIEGRLGLPGFIGPMAAGAVVAAALIPVRRPLSRLVAGYARKLLESRPDASTAGDGEGERQGEGTAGAVLP